MRCVLQFWVVVDREFAGDDCLLNLLWTIWLNRIWVKRSGVRTVLLCTHGRVYYMTLLSLHFSKKLRTDMIRQKDFLTRFQTMWILQKRTIIKKKIEAPPFQCKLKFMSSILLDYDWVSEKNTWKFAALYPVWNLSIILIEGYWTWINVFDWVSLRKTWIPNEFQLKNKMHFYFTGCGG